MAMMALAMWFQDSDAASNRRLIFFLVLLIAVAVVGMAIILVVLALRAFKIIKELTATAKEIKLKAMPLVDEAIALTRSGRQMLEDAAPNVKRITESLARTGESIAESSVVAKSALQKIEATVGDANTRTQRQVARVDSMVTSALNTTAEIVEAVNHGIRVPAQKIAGMVTQAKFAAEGLLEKVKSMADLGPFAKRKVPPTPPVSSAAYPPRNFQ